MESLQGTRLKAYLGSFHDQHMAEEFFTLSPKFDFPSLGDNNKAFCGFLKRFWHVFFFFLYSSTVDVSKFFIKLNIFVTFSSATGNDLWSNFFYKTYYKFGCIPLWVYLIIYFYLKFRKNSFFNVRQKFEFFRDRIVTKGLCQSFFRTADFVTVILNKVFLNSKSLKMFVNNF